MIEFRRSTYDALWESCPVLCRCLMTLRRVGMAVTAAAVSMVATANAADAEIIGGEGITLDASYTTGAEVPLATEGFTATGNKVNFTLNYAPMRGANFVVVENTGLGFIQGAFDGLPNGAPVDLSFDGITYHFVAWYFGGDGNDLVLLWRETGIAAWGDYYNGKLGSEDFVSELYSDAPSAVNQSGLLAGKTIVSLAVGRDHSLALCSDGTLAAWGDHNYGQIGNGLPPQFRVPVSVDRSGVLADKTVISLAAGSLHSLALCSDGTLAAWGTNSSGQLGDATTTRRNVPVAVNQSGILAGKTVLAIAAGNSHSLALCSDGTLAAWGENGRGQLGDNSTVLRNVPVAVNQSGILAGKTVVAIAAGGSHSLALCSDGTLAAWGANTNGQLGDRRLYDYWSVPADVTHEGVLEGKTVVAITAGASHSLALCSDGSLAAWGSNGSGRLGTESLYSQSSPGAVYQGGVLADKAVIAIAAGSAHSLAFCSDGTIAAWGENSDGQLGDNTTIDRSLPVAMFQNGIIGGKRFLGPARSGPSATHNLAVYAAPPEIAVEPANGIDLTDGSANVSFGAGVSAGVPNERTFTIRNSGRGELFLFEITVDGADAGDFTVIRSPASHVLSGNSTSFTVGFKPASAGAKTAVLHIASNEGDENPFDITLTGTGTAGAHLRLGDSLHLDLSWVPLNPGETLRVLGLPPGLVFNAGPPPTITGTALGPVRAGGARIQVLKGNQVQQTFPLELVVEPYPLAGSYELLLEEGGQPTGKLRLTVSNLSVKAPNPTFTATLERPGQAKRSTRGRFSALPKTLPVVFPRFKTHPAITFDVVLTHGSDLVTAATSPSSSLTGRGFRLANSSRIPLGNSAVTLTLPPATPGDRSTTPGGIGYAKGTVTSAALVSLSGQLGDAQPFTTALSLSQTLQAIVWITPYTGKTSYLGGIIHIGDTGAANRSTSPDSATIGLQWKKQTDARSTAYPGGFGPLAISARCNRWVATPTADGLAESLSLDFRALDVAYIAPTAQVLPTRLSLRDNFALLPLAPTDAVPFTGKAIPTTGSFAGNLTLPAPAAKALVSGVFLQDDTSSPLIGQGLVKIFIAGGVKGSFQTVGVEFRQPVTLGTHRHRIGDTVDIDLSAIKLAPGESLRVTGLPPGLALVGSAITGNAYGLVDSDGLQIQVLNGKTVVRTLPLDLAIEPYLFAGSYEVLLEEAGQPVGKLKVILTSPTRDAPYAACTATLDRLGHPRRSGRGGFIVTSPQTVPILFASDGSLPSVGYVLTLTAGSDFVTAFSSPTSSVTGRGFRLARPGHIPTGNPAVTMTFPPVVPGDRLTTPGGIGYAQGTINSQALVPLSGMLGDAQPFTTSLSLSQNNQAIVWLTPYRSPDSYVGGIISLPAPVTPDRNASSVGYYASLKWQRAPDATALSYPNGFRTLSLTAQSSYWAPVKTAAALADSLGLSFRGLNVSYIATPFWSPPSRWSLWDDFTLRSAYPDYFHPLSGKAVGTNGSLRGPLKGPWGLDGIKLSGVFLQNRPEGSVICQGLIKMVSSTTLVKGAYETAGIELKN